MREKRKADKGIRWIIVTYFDEGYTFIAKHTAKKYFVLKTVHSNPRQNFVNLTLCYVI